MRALRVAVLAWLVLHCVDAFVLVPGDLHGPVGQRGPERAASLNPAHLAALLRQGGSVARVPRRDMQLEMLMDPSLAQNPLLALLFPSFLFPFVLLSYPFTWYLLFQCGFVLGLKAMAKTGDYVDRKVCTGQVSTLAGPRNRLACQNMSGCCYRGRFTIQVAAACLPCSASLVAVCPDPFYCTHPHARARAHTRRANIKHSINVDTSAATHQRILPSLDQEIVCATRTSELCSGRSSAWTTGPSNTGWKRRAAEGWRKVQRSWRRRVTVDEGRSLEQQSTRCGYAARAGGRDV